MALLKVRWILKCSISLQLDGVTHSSAASVILDLQYSRNYRTPKVGPARIFKFTPVVRGYKPFFKLILIFESTEFIV